MQTLICQKLDKLNSDILAWVHVTRSKWGNRWAPFKINGNNFFVSNANKHRAWRLQTLGSLQLIYLSSCQNKTYWAHSNLKKCHIVERWGTIQTLQHLIPFHSNVPVVEHAPFVCALFKLLKYFKFFSKICSSYEQSETHQKVKCSRSKDPIWQNCLVLFFFLVLFFLQIDSNSMKEVGHSWHAEISAAGYRESKLCLS